MAEAIYLLPTNHHYYLRSTGGTEMRMDRHGWILPDTDGMMFPVRCAHCHNGVYDLASVTVTARYTDCSVWKSPCCGQVVDDRKPPWTHRAHYEELR